MGHLDHMSREEFLGFAKERALRELPDVANAISSFLSDLGKHSEFENHAVKDLIAMHILADRVDEHTVRQLIEGTR